jgi:hypothetical protein
MQHCLLGQNLVHQELNLLIYTWENEGNSEMRLHLPAKVFQSSLSPLGQFPGMGRQDRPRMGDLVHLTCFCVA